MFYNITDICLLIIQTFDLAKAKSSQLFWQCLLKNVKNNINDKPLGEDEDFLVQVC